MGALRGLGGLPQGAKRERAIGSKRCPGFPWAARMMSSEAQEGSGRTILRGASALSYIGAQLGGLCYKRLERTVKSKIAALGASHSAGRLSGRAPYAGRRNSGAGGLLCGL